MIVDNMLDLIGHTPLIRLKINKNDWEIFIKLEKFNPGQSMKDRMALNMVTEAEKRGDLKPGGTIIESSSGNTAIGLAIVSAIKGYKFIAVVDHHASEDKIKIIKAYGGEIVVVGDDKEDNEVAVVERENKALEIAKTIPNSFVPRQHENKDNRGAYIDTLAKELLNEVGKIDELYGSIGTGGSICGTAIGLKKHHSNCKINAVEPVGSIIFGGKGGPYYQSGAGNPPDAEIPPIIDYALIDKNYYASDKEAFNTCRYFAKNYGIMLGGSAGGVLFTAIKEISKKTGKGKVVVLACDGGEKYLDKIYNDSWMVSHNMIDKNIDKKLDKWLRRENGI